MERIDQIQGQSIIGKMYLVPCVRISDQSNYHSFFNGGWTPIIGESHNDKEFIGADFEHFHFDWRFFATVDGKEESRRFGKAVDVKYVTEGPVLKRRKCRQAMPDFPINYQDRREVEIEVEWLAPIERAYADVKLKPDCRVCPHRGMPLGGLPVKGGMAVCPGHGLRWNVETGEMVPRVAKGGC